MPSEARLNFLKNCLIYVSKGVIWASEYSLGPQIWGPGGPGPRSPPPDPLLNLSFTCSSTCSEQWQPAGAEGSMAQTQNPEVDYYGELQSNGRRGARACTWNN